MNNMMIYFLFICFLMVSPGAMAYDSASDALEAEGEAAREMREDEALASREMEGSIQGRVISANAFGKTLVVKENQYSDDLYTFNVHEDAEIQGAASLSDIHPGDIVSVDFYDMGDDRITDNIVLESRAENREVPSKLEKVLVD